MIAGGGIEFIPGGRGLSDLRESWMRTIPSPWLIVVMEYGSIGSGGGGRSNRGSVGTWYVVLGGLDGGGEVREGLG